MYIHMYPLCKKTFTLTEGKCTKLGGRFSFYRGSSVGVGSPKVKSYIVLVVSLGELASTMITIIKNQGCKGKCIYTYTHCVSVFYTYTRKVYKIVGGF